jgi:hypothetical protein
MKQFFLICLLASATAFAQKGWFVGASGAFNASFILNQNNYGTLAPFEQQVVRQSELAYIFTPGGTAGIHVGYMFKDNWGIQAQLQYNKAGQHYEDDMYGPATIPEGKFGTTGNRRVKVKRNVDFHYLQVPILVKYSVGDELTRFYAAAGPVLGTRLGASEKVTIAGYTYLPDSLKFTPSEKFSPIDFGFALNIGVEIWFKKEWFINIGLHNYISILDINGKKMRQIDYYSKNDIEYQESRNLFIGINVGISYFFNKNKPKPTKEGLRFKD